jgi:hypothetical protein
VANGPGETGAAMCQCPSEAFFVEVHGYGDPAVLSFEGMHVPPWCEGASTSNVPLGSAHESCGFVSIVELSACAGPNHGPPCLDVSGSGNYVGTYVDLTGRSWPVRSFTFRTRDAGNAPNGTLSGSYDAVVDYGKTPVAISGNLYVCGTVIGLLRPCH